MQLNFRALIKKEKPENGENPKPNKILIFVIIAAILVLAVSSFFGGDNKKKEEKPAEADKETTDAGQYVKDMEYRLSETLKKINGAGNVSVFISIDGGGEKKLATDTKEKVLRQSEETQKDAEESSTEKSVVLTDDGKEKTPFVVEERLPAPSGILVVAEGAKDEKVKFEIYDAVKAIYGLSAHRIKVTY